MKIKQKIRKSIIILILMFILTSFCVFHANLNPAIINMFADKFSIITNKNNMLVHFIDVGQGDAVAINFPDGKIMVIDCGSQKVNTDFVKYIRDNVTNTKKKNFIDYLVLSHADEDHVGGAEKLLENFEVGVVYMPKVGTETNVYERLVTFVEDNCRFTICGNEFVIEERNYSIKFFEVLGDENTNDSSQLVKVSAFGTSFLFTGDVSSGMEANYINVYGDELDCDVLKVSHHGAKTSTSAEFVDAVSPDYSIISVGEENSYGHPNEETIMLLDEKSEIIRTDKSGDILFAVGNIYGLTVLNGNYSITGLSLDYVGLIVICDVCLVLICVKVILNPKKEK